MLDGEVGETGGFADRAAEQVLDLADRCARAMRDRSVEFVEGRGDVDAVCAAEIAMQLLQQQPAGTGRVSGALHQVAGGGHQLAARNRRGEWLVDDPPDPGAPRDGEHDECDSSEHERHPDPGRDEVAQRFVARPDVLHPLARAPTDEERDVAAPFGHEERDEHTGVVGLTQVAVGERLVVADADDQTGPEAPHDHERRRAVAARSGGEALRLVGTHREQHPVADEDTA